MALAFCFLVFSFWLVLCDTVAVNSAVGVMKMNEGGRSNLMVGGESSRALEVLECLADLGVAAEPLCTKALPGAGHHTPGRSLLDWK